MKKLNLHLGSLLILLAVGSSAQNTFPDIRSHYDGPNWTPQADTGITCSPSPPGIMRDDGTYENGYRTITNGDSTRFVQKMIMPSQPITLTAICVTWSALSPSGSLTYDLVVYDTTGAGDSPGNLVASVNGVSAPSIAIYPLHSRYRYNVNIPLTQRAYYIGVRWDNNPVLPFFISADENGTIGGDAYKIPSLGGVYIWTSVIIEFTNFRNFGIRAEGFLVGIQPVSSEVPNDYRLHQNYPNPFNPVTYIKFGMPKNSLVKLVIYDVLGSEIAVLVNEKLTAGEYGVDWDASKYPSGVYFYRLFAGDYTQTKKMVLIK
ncbi:MAG: T9SS type A sorting domain-containing protein [Chlorobi bacterium]|nr:T9SS type A sorting domain-containing protein [Chlorobiota bacterium]MCI0715369.1 T9SS type A sorting domain-containing protein [Chlorobiota bacterium]